MRREIGDGKWNVGLEGCGKEKNDGRSRKKEKNERRGKKARGGRVDVGEMHQEVQLLSV